MVELLFQGQHVPGKLIPDYRKPLRVRPRYVGDGDIAFKFPRSWMQKNDEKALTYCLISDRRLFGDAYSTLLPDYFDTMPHNSGVMIKCLVPTCHILPNVLFPGDIDLLIIPYEDNELVLSMTLAVEVKIVRASFKNQGKSPNQYGFSQAQALLVCGFPHAAVAHLIVSDKGPPTSWREVFTTRMIDSISGSCEKPKPVLYDMLPLDLINRSYGRLLANCPEPTLGLLATYISDSIWSSQGKQAIFNSNSQSTTLVMNAIADYYYENAQEFLDTRKYPPNT